MSETLPTSQGKPEGGEENQGLARRRKFLRDSIALVGGAFAGTAMLAGSAQPAAAQAPGSVTLTRQIRLVQRHENDHVDFLVGALGPAARPKPTFRNLEQSSRFRFLVISRTLENTGVGAYLGAAPAISDPDTLAAAGSIALIEGRHAGLFNSLQGRAMSENVFGEEQSFERALTIAEVVTLAGPFVASLNGGPPLSFDPNPANRSEQNDIAILNFALALEYLEAEFYNINVPKFYG